MPDLSKEFLDIQATIECGFSETRMRHEKNIQTVKYCLPVNTTTYIQEKTIFYSNEYLTLQILYNRIKMVRKSITQKMCVWPISKEEKTDNYFLNSVHTSSATNSP